MVGRANVHGTLMSEQVCSGHMGPLDRQNNKQKRLKTLPFSNFVPRAVKVAAAYFTTCSHQLLVLQLSDHIPHIY